MWGHVGPLHKIYGYWGHQNVSKCRPHHSGDVQGKTIEYQVFIYGPKPFYLWLFEGPFNDQTGPILLSSYPLTHIYVYVKLDMFPGIWGCSRYVRFACHTSSMHIQSTKAMYNVSTNTFQIKTKSFMFVIESKLDNERLNIGKLV